MSHKKWLREMKAKDDKKQARFTSWGSVKEPVQTAIIIGQTVSMTEQFMCPFCLGIAPLQKYLISTSKGYHKGNARCPECNNQMRITTLLAEWTPEQYADFVYPYSASGFWQKCKFNIWKERLYKIGWAHRFWARYKQLKGESEEERETIIDKQEKMRGECQHCGEKNEPDTVICKYCGHRLIEAYG